MHVCAIASARATIGGPSFALRTRCRNAWFHGKTTLPPGGTPRALDASLGNASDAAPAPAATRKRRRESGCSRASKRELLGPGEIERRDGEVKTSDEIARLPQRCRRRQRLVQARAPPRGRARAGLAASSSPLCRTLPQRQFTPLVLIWPICAGRTSAVPTHGKGFGAHGKDRPPSC